jgi:tetratricopeptide (TPR) repeat protein/TolB-like protein
VPEVGHRDILDSWKQISAYVGRDVRTCQRYEQELGLPVHRLDESAKARVFAYEDEIDSWREKKLHEADSGAPRFRSRVRSNPMLFAIPVFLVAAFGAFLAWRFSTGARGLGAGARPSIAILPLENTDGEAGLESWREGIPRLLVQGLSRSKFFDVLSDDRIYGILKELSLSSAREYSTAELKEIAKKGPATHTVTGKVIRAGIGFVISLNVQRPGTDDIYPSRYECEDESAVVKAIDRMVSQVKKDLGLSRSQMAGDHDAMAVEVSTTSFEAFRMYNEGRRFHLAEEYEKSERLMRKAVDLDPEFALAWRSLAMSLQATGAEAEADACIQKALVSSRKSSTREQLWIKVDYFNFKAEYGKALEACRQWTSLYPEDTQALMLTGRQYLYVEDFERACRSLEESLRKGDTNPYTFYWAALAWGLAGKFDEADHLCERGLSMHPENKIIIRAGIYNAVAQGSFDKALREAQKYESADLDGSLGLLAGDIFLLNGDFAGAERQYARFGQDIPVVLTRLSRLALAEGKYDHAAELAGRAKNHLLLAYIEARRGRLTEGLVEADKALSAAEGRGHLLGRLKALQMKGLIEALQGNLTAAGETASRLRDNSDSGIQKAQDRDARFLAGLIDSASGRSARAIEEFEAAVAVLPRESAEIEFNWHALYLFYAAEERGRAGDGAGAAELYERILGLNTGRLQHPDLTALSHYALGRIAEIRGDTAAARQSYGMFLKLWKNADLGQLKVVEARARLDPLN